MGEGNGGNSRGFTNEQSPQGGAFSRDLLDQKSKSLLFPGPGGLWLQMTIALRRCYSSISSV